MAGGDGCWMRPVWGRDRGLQALRRLAAPRWRRQVDRTGECELYLEPSPARPRRLLDEPPSMLDLPRAGVGPRFIGTFSLTTPDHCAAHREASSAPTPGSCGCNR